MSARLWRLPQKLDPQIRKLLELTWEAWMDAGVDVAQLRGGPVGVYVGCCGSDCGHMHTWQPDLAAHDGYENLGARPPRSFLGSCRDLTPSQHAMTNLSYTLNPRMYCSFNSTLIIPGKKTVLLRGDETMGGVPTQASPAAGGTSQYHVSPCLTGQACLLTLTAEPIMVMVL